MTAPVQDDVCPPTPCPPWCRDDHRLIEIPAGEGNLFHQSAPRLFQVTHTEAKTPETCDVILQKWNDADADLVEPAAVVLEIESDCFGQAWLTVEQARLLAAHLLAAADELAAQS